MIIDKSKYELALANACLSKKDLEKQGIAKGTLQNIHREKNLLPQTVGKIAAVLNVRAEDLVKEAT
jgi:hypothetical protein